MRAYIQAGNIDNTDSTGRKIDRQVFRQTHMDSKSVEQYREPIQYQCRRTKRQTQTDTDRTVQKDRRPHRHHKKADTDRCSGGQYRPCSTTWKTQTDIHTYNRTRRRTLTWTVQGDRHRQVFKQKTVQKDF